MIRTPRVNRHLIDEVRSYPDPVGEIAAARADSLHPGPLAAGDLDFQCLRCHATGSEADANAWPVLAGQRFHVLNTVEEVTRLDALGAEETIYESRRQLCGPAKAVKHSR